MSQMPCKASSVYDLDLATAAAAAATQARAAAARSAARAPPERIPSDREAAAPEPGLNRAMQVRKTLNPHTAPCWFAWLGKCFGSLQHKGRLKAATHRGRVLRGTRA